MLDKNSAQPLYVQFENVIRSKLDNEEWLVGAMIPSENELAKIYGISRMTVRSVLNQAVSAGMFYRVPGKGTFVAEPKIESSPLAHMGIREQLEKKGYEIHTKLLEVEQLPASVRVAKLLGIEPKELVYKVRRLRYLKDIPLSIHTSYIPQSISPGLESRDLEKVQLCDILEQDYHCTIIRHVEMLESVTASAAEAQLLEVEKASPLLMLENTVYGEGDVPIEHSKVVFRGDKIKLRMEYTQ